MVKINFLKSTSNKNEHFCLIKMGNPQLNLNKNKHADKLNVWAIKFIVFVIFLGGCDVCWIEK